MDNYGTVDNPAWISTVSHALMYAETLCTSVTHEMSPARSPTMVNQCTSVADPITTLESEQFVTSQKKCSLFPDDSGPPTNFVESGAGENNI